MGIQNSLDFSYANVKSRNLQMTTTKSADSCLMQFGIIKHLLTGYLSNRKGIIALSFVLGNTKLGIALILIKCLPHMTHKWVLLDINVLPKKRCK